MKCREAQAWVGVFVTRKAWDCLGSVGIRDGNHRISQTAFSHHFLSHRAVSSPTLIPACSASTCWFSNPAFSLCNLQSHKVYAKMSFFLMVSLLFLQVIQSWAVLLEIIRSKGR